MSNHKKARSIYLHVFTEKSKRKSIFMMQKHRFLHNVVDRFNGKSLNARAQRVRMIKSRYKIRINCILTFHFIYVNEYKIEWQRPSHRYRTPLRPAVSSIFICLFVCLLDRSSIPFNSVVCLFCVCEFFSY